MKRILLSVFLLTCAIPGFSKELPGIDFFLRLLGKDTAVMFDSLRQAGFRQTNVQAHGICCGDYDLENPPDECCVTFETDSSTLSMCVDGERGIASFTLSFVKAQPVYFRDAEKHLAAEQFVKKSTLAGYRNYAKAPVICDVVTITKHNLFYITASNESFRHR